MRLALRSVPGDVTLELYQAPAKSMDVSVGSGDVEMTVPNSTGFKASLTLGSGDFESDFLPLDYDGETILNLEFDNAAISLLRIVLRSVRATCRLIRVVRQTKA